MRELSLFTGAGGGVYASRLLGHTVVAYVEKDQYCQRVIKARISDGTFDDAPVFDDVRTFDGYAWRGKIDLLTGGFPCQPFSVAGKARAAADPRNMWPETVRIIRECRPALAFLENVPGLLSKRHGYFRTILRDLAEAGYDAVWDTFSAAEAGAPHIRKRLFILAALPDALGERRRETHAAPCGLPTQEPESPGGGQWWSRDPAEDSAAESRVGRVAHGVADRSHRLRALGNGQVPAVVGLAFRTLSAQLVAEVQS